MKKRFTSFTLAAILILTAFAGCASTESSSAAPEASTASASSASSEVPSAGNGEGAAFSPKKGDQYVIGYAAKDMSESYAIWLEHELTNLCAADYSDLFQVVSQDAQGEATKQVTCIENFIAMGVDILIVQAVDPDPIVDVVKRASDAGIHTIVIDAAWGDEYDGISSCILNSETETGKMVAEYAAEQLPENAQVVLIRGIAGNVAGEQRAQGILDTLGGLRSDIKFIDDQNADWDNNQAMALMEDWLVAHPQIDGVLSCNDNMALGAIQALKAAKRLDGTYISGVDCLYAACQAIQDGEMAATVLKDAHTLMEMALQIAKEYLVEGKGMQRLSLRCQLVTADNVAETMKMLEEQGMAN